MLLGRRSNCRYGTQPARSASGNLSQIQFWNMFLQVNIWELNVAIWLFTVLWHAVIIEEQPAHFLSMTLPGKICFAFEGHRAQEGTANYFCSFCFCVFHTNIYLNYEGRVVTDYVRSDLNTNLARRWIQLLKIASNTYSGYLGSHVPISQVNIIV